MKLNTNDKTNIRLRKEVVRLLATDMEFRQSPLLIWAYVSIGHLLGLISSDCTWGAHGALPFDHNFDEKLPLDRLKTFKLRYQQSSRTEVTISNGLIVGSGLGISIRFLQSGRSTNSLALGQIGIWVESTSVRIAENFA